MEIPKKGYGYTGTYRLYPDSVLRRFRIKDDVLDDKGAIELFANNTYRLLVTTDVDKKIESIVYKSNYDENIDITDFKKDALDVITKSLNRIQIAFMYSRNKGTQTAISNNQEISVDILNYETGVKPFIVEAAIGYSRGICIVPDYIPIVSIQTINTVLEIYKENIDEYIEKFLNLENLSNDLVLHLITLYSLYEYINKTSSNDLENLFKQQEIEERFRFTRNFAAHGTVGERLNVKNFLKNSLGESQQDFYSFDRYNQSHINLINHVISEYQVIIHDYLKEQLGIIKFIA